MNSLPPFLLENSWIFLLILLWSIPWKGVALWKAARLYHVRWFIILLVLNTGAILEIIYIFFIARKTEREQAIETTDQ